MASQPGSQGSRGSQGGPVLLELAKYSYATVPMNSVAPVPWIHIANTSSLIAYFEIRRSLGPTGAMEEQSIFKVLKDPEVMEELDLRALGREAQRALEASRDAMQHSGDQNVAVIIRAPIIAIKYPRNEREVRRFQIRFQSNEDFYEAMKMLSRANVPTLEAGTFPAQRPHTAATHSSFTSTTAAPQTPVAVRPFTAVRSATVASAPAALPRPTTSSSSLMLPPSHVSAPGGFAKTNSPYFGQTPGIVHLPERTGNSQREFEHGVSGPVSNGAPPSNVQSITSREYVSPSQPQQPVANLYGSGVSPRECVSVFREDKPAFDLYTPRPSTAPAKYSQHLSQVLPPKRDLPFETKQKSTTSREPLKELRNGRRYPAEPPQARPAREGPENATQLDTAGEAQDSSQGAKKRRRAPAKSPAKAAAPKKPRVIKNTASKSTSKPASRQASRPATRSETASIPVPSIEDLLKKDAMQAESTRMVEDTQALLDRAAASLKSSLAKQIFELPGWQTAGSGPSSQTKSKAIDSPELVATPAYRPSRPPTADGLEPDASKLPDTPADRSTELNTPAAAEPIDNADAEALAVFDERPKPSPSTPTDQPTDYAAPNSHTAADTSNPNQPCVPTPDLQAISTEFRRAYDTLMQQPDFADSNAKLGGWAAQSEDVGERAINRFICDAYQNKNFWKLCERLDGNVGGMIVWPGVYKYGHLGLGPGLSDDEEIEQAVGDQ